MGRHEENSAGAHFRAPKQLEPVAPARAPNPEKCPESISPHGGVASRGVGARSPDRPEQGDPRYARRDRHNPSHRSRPPVGAPCGALYSGADTGAPSQWSATARHQRPLLPCVRPARRRAVVWLHRVTERLSTPRTATHRRGVKYVQSRISEADVICPSRTSLFDVWVPSRQRRGRPFWSHGSLLSGSRRARPCKRVGDIGSFAVDTTLGGVGRRSPVSIATKGHVM